MRMNWKAILFLGALILVWHFVSNSGIVNPILFPGPLTVAKAGAQWFWSGNLLADLMASIGNLFFGLLLGSLIGIGSGLVMGRVFFLEETIGSTLHILRAFPPVAIIPLVIVWLGIGDIAKVFSIAFAVFFPVWVSALQGSKSIAKEYLRVSKIFSKSKRKTFFKVVVPATTPFLINGFRIAIGIAFIMVFVSELAGASSGLGYFIANAQIVYRADRMIAGLIVLGSLAFLVDYAFVHLSKKFFPWVNLK